MRKPMAASLVLFLGGAAALAQQPAPRDTATAEVGGKTVAIEYGRPALKGRSFSELKSKLPSDRMWRAGSEQVTTLKTDVDLMIGGKHVPAGKYSLYVHCPESGYYALAVNKVLGQPLGDIWDKAPPHLAKEPWPHFSYEKEIGDQEVARIPLKSAELEEPVDLFTISLTPNAYGAELKMEWGTESWSADVKAAKESAGSHGR